MLVISKSWSLSFPCLTMNFPGGTKNIFSQSSTFIVKFEKNPAHRSGTFSDKHGRVFMC